ncbi:hypothetical protein [Bacillus sp. EB600]|uniref:hypothetical protein n=1 Tax=Bacillus sp. EB600 TaxID=2806345 RepID=UPI00210CCE89|nr:hypothetical protein [Bacillus sp. EB600]MCQ6281618.1 hypothetical protein [Bacillus sp. EB600]
MPTIIQVNNQSFKYHDQPLVAFFEEPLESVYYVRNPEQHIEKTSPKLFRIKKKGVEFAIKMKVLPDCIHCGRTMQVTKVEPYIHGNYRITFHCQNNQCGKHIQTIYYENVLNEEFC